MKKKTVVNIDYLIEKLFSYVGCPFDYHFKGEFEEICGCFKQGEKRNNPNNCSDARGKRCWKKLYERDKDIVQ